MSERAIPTKRHFDSLQCLTNALHKKSFYLGSPGSSSPDESTCLGLCAWPRWLYIPLLLPPLETGSRLSVETGNLAFRRNAKTPIFKLPLIKRPAARRRFFLIEFTARANTKKPTGPVGFFLYWMDPASLDTNGWYTAGWKGP